MLAICREAAHILDNIEEVHDLAVERVQLAGGNKTVHPHGAVVAVPELPVAAGSLDSADGATNGCETTEVGKPAQIISLDRCIEDGAKTYQIITS